MDLSEEFDFSNNTERNYAPHKLEQKPRLLILQSKLDIPTRGIVAESRTREHAQFVTDLAMQQNVLGGGFIVISDRDDSHKLLETPDCVFVTLEVCKFGIS